MNTTTAPFTKPTIKPSTHEATRALAPWAMTLALAALSACGSQASRAPNNAALAAPSLIAPAARAGESTALTAAAATPGMKPTALGNAPANTPVPPAAAPSINFPNGSSASPRPTPSATATTSSNTVTVVRSQTGSANTKSSTPPATPVAAAAAAAIDFSVLPPTIGTRTPSNPFAPQASMPALSALPAPIPLPVTARIAAPAAPLANLPADAFDRLLALMAGSFSSEQQSIDDRAFFDIRLHMARIWTSGPRAQPASPHTRTAWLYVEQAMATTLDKPYRQRIYRLTQLDATTFKSEVFELPGDPLRFAGTFASPQAFNNLTPDQLSARAGCEILLASLRDGTFEGTTNGRDCPSSLRGASYATSQARITAEGLITWDRGFNDKAEQVWGATKSGYIFRRVQ